MSEPSNEAKLAILRIHLFTAMQQLKGEDLDRFWELIDELVQCGPAASIGFRGATQGPIWVPAVTGQPRKEDNPHVKRWRFRSGRS